MTHNCPHCGMINEKPPFSNKYVCCQCNREVTVRGRSSYDDGAQRSCSEDILLGTIFSTGSNDVTPDSDSWFSGYGGGDSGGGGADADY